MTELKGTKTRLITGKTVAGIKIPAPKNDTEKNLTAQILYETA